MTGARFALVAVDSVEYAIESAWVRRTLPAPSPLPAAVVHGGTVYPLLDLHRLFGLPAVDPQAARLILVLAPPPGIASGGPAGAAPAWRLALVVDVLLGVEPLAAGEAVPLPAVYRGPERRWFRGLLPRAGGRIAVLLRPEGLAATAAPAPPGGAAC